MGLGCMSVLSGHPVFEEFCEFACNFTERVDLPFSGDIITNFIVQMHSISWRMVPKYITLPSLFSSRRLPYILFCQPEGQ